MSKMDSFATIINSFELLIIVLKLSTLNVYIQYIVKFSVWL